MKHPGKTPAQRRVLDEIGCGNHSPIMAKATRDKLLRDGLIVELSPGIHPFVGALTFQIRRFEMPISVHMQWCEAMSDQSELPPYADALATARAASRPWNCEEAYAAFASAGTHPKDGDSTQIEAPLVSGATAKPGRPDGVTPPQANNQ